jgi:hypothetical protein
MCRVVSVLQFTVALNLFINLGTLLAEESEANFISA